MGKSNYKQAILLSLIILFSILIRIFFSTGHIFSDDAYYSFLSYSILKGDLTREYLGYPVFPLRIAFIGLNAISMMIFGTNEFATLFFPFLFSIINVLLVFKLTDLITENKAIALTASMLAAFFPTDVLFASISFPDLIATFFINLGIYFLLKSYYQKIKYYALVGGLSFFLSMQFKESIYYILFLLVILLGYFLLKNRRMNFQLVIGIIFILGNYLIEGVVYLFLYNEFFYRITITNINYNFSFYDFFPYTAEKISGSKYYIRNLFDQVFLINIKSIFLRRFYLFLPIISAVQTFFSFNKKENRLLLFWFWGSAIFLIAFTTSFSEYKPLDLARSWYIYPLLMPMLILSAIFLNNFSKLIRNGLITIYILGSLIMCFEYQLFFNKDNLDFLKKYLRKNSSKNIYTDHYTKYSVDLTREYKTGKSYRILGKEFELNQIPAGDWILFNKKHIEELKLQRYLFPDFEFLKSNQFKKIASFDDFIFYEKIR